MEEKNSFGNMIKNTVIPIVLYYVANQASAIVFREVLLLFYSKELLQSTGLSAGIKMAAMAVGGIVVYPFYMRQLQSDEKNMEKKISPLILVKIAIGGVVLALILNVIFALSGFLQSSDSYGQVAKIQFSLAIFPALLYYALLSPLVEEMVFRGIVFSVLEKGISQRMAILWSSILFGAFHGNIVQMVYGTIMGIIMAYIYSRYKKLITPIVFHAAANAAVYVCSFYF